MARLDTIPKEILEMIVTAAKESQTASEYRDFQSVLSRTSKVFTKRFQNPLFECISIGQHNVDDEADGLDIYTPFDEKPQLAPLVHSVTLHIRPQVICICKPNFNVICHDHITKPFVKALEPLDNLQHLTIAGLFSPIDPTVVSTHPCRHCNRACDGESRSRESWRELVAALRSVPALRGLSSFTYAASAPLDLHILPEGSIDNLYISLTQCYGNQDRDGPLPKPTRAHTITLINDGQEYLRTLPLLLARLEGAQAVNLVGSVNFVPLLAEWLAEHRVKKLSIKRVEEGKEAKASAWTRVHVAHRVRAYQQEVNLLRRLRDLENLVYETDMENCALALVRQLPQSLKTLRLIVPQPCMLEVRIALSAPSLAHIDSSVHEMANAGDYQPDTAGPAAAGLHGGHHWNWNENFGDPEDVDTDHEE